MKRIATTILVVLLLIGTITAYADSPFTDLKSSNWAYESVNAMKTKGIIQGFPDGSFKPSKEVTYGEFIKMLVSSMGYANLPAPEAGKNWSYPYYKKAVDLKLFMGSELDSDKYQMDREIPREMMAYMIANALGSIDIESKYATYKEKITDVEDGNEFMYPIVKVYCTGILTGYPDGTFQPKESLTRAETAVSLGRYIQYSNGEEMTAVKQQEAAEKAAQEKTTVETYLQKEIINIKGIENNYEYYGVESAQELKEVHPIIYYSILEESKGDLLFSTMVTNPEELRSPFTDEVAKKTYAYKEMTDIGITKIEKTKVNNPALQYKYDIDQIVVTPKYENTDQMEAVLIKGNKIVCKLNGVKETDGSIEYGISGKVVNKVYISLLPDFDYIGFYEYSGANSVFLVKKPW